MKKYYFNGKRCSKGEYIISKLLKSNNVNFIREKTFSKCLSPKNRKLRFDFYLPDFKVLLEFQGEQHYKPINKSYKSISKFKRLKIHDNIKKQFCEKNNLKLIAIPYTFRNKLDILIPKLIEKLTSSSIISITNDQS
jgi:hypothetical protein